MEEDCRTRDEDFEVAVKECKPLLPDMIRAGEEGGRAKLKVRLRRSPMLLEELKRGQESQKQSELVDCVFSSKLASNW